MFTTFATSRLREILAAKVGNTWGEKCAGKFSLKMPDFHVTFRGSFTCRKTTTWDPQLYFPYEGRRAEDCFVALKNPTASAGFEPANLGTKGQHATSRPPKPLERDS
jgi:hypothetical protein